MDQAYAQRTDAIRTYFDRTAVEQWKRFATEAPLGRIRESVREGRSRMRAEMLAMLPGDLAGWRILDAGCGTGAMSVELARRGATVTGVDLAPEIVRFAEETRPQGLRGRIAYVAGDMLSPAHGRFDAIVSMDALIHYSMAQAVESVDALASRAGVKMVFTFAPATPALSLMHAVGRLFPRSDRSPAIQPVAEARLRRALASRAGLAGWNAGRSARVAHGFYTSQALELVRR